MIGRRRFLSLVGLGVVAQALPLPAAPPVALMEPGTWLGFKWTTATQIPALPDFLLAFKRYDPDTTAFLTLTRDQIAEAFQARPACPVVEWEGRPHRIVGDPWGPDSLELVPA